MTHATWNDDSAASALYWRFGFRKAVPLSTPSLPVHSP
jgi:hypothetical protein